MFTTFVTAPAPTSSSGPDPSAAPRPRPKRAQVQRACDWCRLTRVKCDSFRPCQTCKQAGRHCSSGGQESFRSVAAATREVDRLRDRVQELEAKLKQATGSNSLSSSTPAQNLANQPPERSSPYRTQPHRWKGIRLGSAYYGISSLPFFLRRMSSHLAHALDQPHSDIASYPSLGASNLAELFATDLQRPQQDYFIDLFWEAHHVIFPIIDEVDFREHYKSLWNDSNSDEHREESPLVDIILALCVQFGSPFILGSDKGVLADVAAQNEANLGGYAYYQRCHAYLEANLEAPSLTTVQCYIFSAVYLNNAGLVNTAHATVGKAIAAANLIGINNELANDLPDDARQLGRRIWWTLCQLDAQAGIELGRPWLLWPSQSFCPCPSDSIKVAEIFGSSYVLEGGVHALGTPTQFLLLYDTLRSIYNAFYDRYDDIITELNGEDIYHNAPAREKWARTLIEQARRLTSWAQQVPEAYKVPRRSGGKPLSTDRSLLDLSPETPVWLQRQRLLLELHYHHNAINLYRQFVCFLSTPPTSTPLSDNNARSCLSHAITLTNIIHQVLTETDILNGWYQVFQWQKNAAFVMIGFACGYPVCPPTPSARRAVATALSVFDLFGQNFSEAKYVASLVKELDEKTEAVIARFRARLLGSSPPALVSGSSSSQSTPSISRTTPTANTSDVTTEAGQNSFWAPDLERAATQLESQWWEVDSPDMWADFMKELDVGQGSDVMMRMS